MQSNEIINLLNKHIKKEQTEHKGLKSGKGFLIYSKETIDNPHFIDLKELYDESYKDIKEKNIFRYFYYENLSNEHKSHATIIMMNPAFADSDKPDKTIENIKKFFADYNQNSTSDAPKIGQFDIINLFPIRMPKSKKLKNFLTKTENQTKIYENFVKSYLQEKCNDHIIIAAWGSKYNYRAKKLLKDINLKNVKCYAKNRYSPKHFGSMAFNNTKIKTLQDYNI